jgi:hypothetical protein
MIILLRKLKFEVLESQNEESDVIDKKFEELRTLAKK